MSSALTKARQQLASTGTLLKQGKLSPAVTGLRDACISVVKSQLMKAERDEFSRLIEQAVYLLNGDKSLRQAYPLVIAYKPGEEKALVEILRELLNALQASAVDEAMESLASIEKRKQDALTQAQDLLDQGQTAEAASVLEKITREFSKDAVLQAKASDMLLRAELFEDAFTYLDRAIEAQPEDIRLYNRIAVVLRKLGRFDVAEKYFMRAVSFAKEDPNLYFNLGRVYLDWGRYDKVEKAAKIALRLSPEFEEAKKLLAFALRKQNKTA